MQVKCGYVKVFVLNLYFTKMGCQVGQIQTIGIHRFFIFCKNAGLSAWLLSALS